MSITEYEMFLDIFENLIINNDNILIVGDLNVPNFIGQHSHGTKSKLLNSFMNICNLNQHNCIQYVYNKMLDLVIYIVKLVVIPLL